MQNILSYHKQTRGVNHEINTSRPFYSIQEFLMLQAEGVIMCDLAEYVQSLCIVQWHVILT